MSTPSARDTDQRVPRFTHGNTVRVYGAGSHYIYTAVTIIKY